jgi:hypothetical protein
LSFIDGAFRLSRRRRTVNVLSDNWRRAAPSGRARRAIHVDRKKERNSRCYYLTIDASFGASSKSGQRPRAALENVSAGIGPAQWEGERSLAPCMRRFRLGAKDPVILLWEWLR